MDNKDYDTYELITNLIEKQVNIRNLKNDSVNKTVVLKKLRSTAFEVLLKKKVLQDDEEYVPSSCDIICNLLAWQFKNKNQPDKCVAIRNIIKRIEELNIFKDELYKKSTLFLLYLQDSTIENEQSSISRLISKDFKWIKQNYLQAERSLKLSLSALNLSENVSSKSSLKLSTPTSLLGFHIKEFSSKPSFLHDTNPLFDSKGVARTERTSYKSDSNVLKLTCSQPVLSLNDITIDNLDRTYYNWEYLDNLHIRKESPFVCEAGPNILNLFQKIINTYTCRLISCMETDITPEIISKELFIKNVKFMLVGTRSELFDINEKNQFQLKKTIFIEGVSVDTLKSYCADLLFMGTCFRSLSNISTTYGSNSGKNCGYIFKELCESIKRYLTFYRVVVLSLPNTISLLSLHNSVSKMKDQISVLARIMKVSPFSTDATYTLPQSADLLTYLYEELMNVTDNDLALVLYSAFYPCCQIYFQKFLQRWLFDGILVDPYEEFFIKVDNNYTKYRSRIYWTKHFILKPIPLPGFLLELKNNILLCGKTMNLLKLCNPDTPLCKYVIDSSVPLVNCCLTSHQLGKSKEAISEYYIETASLCGPRISLIQKLREREEEQLLFLSKVQQKQAFTLRRIELQRQKEAEEKAAKKRKIYEELKEQMRLAEAFRMKEKEKELKKDLVLAQKNAELEEKKTILLKQEADNIIKYYDELFEAVDNRRASIEKRKEKLQNYIVNQTRPTKKIKDDTETEHNEEKTDDDEKNAIEIIEKSSTVATSEDYYDCISVDNEEFVTNETDNLDVINANIDEDVKKHNKINDAFEEARRNKAKVMNLEFGTEIKNKSKRVEFISDDNSNLTDAQKNKLKVMKSEYQVYLERDIKKDTINCNDTNNLIVHFNDNMASPGQEQVMNAMHKKNILSLPKHIQQLNLANNEIYNNIDVYNSRNKLNADNEMPMSIGSTPNTESFKDFATPSTSKLFLSTESALDSAPTIDTANSIFNDDGFKFPSVETINLSHKTSNTERTESRILKSHVNNIFNCNIRHLLSQSIFIPLEAQMKLVNNEILKYFLIDQKLFSHLHSLRCYFFLLDGEFGRHITDGLFNKLYEVKKPIELLNGRCLQLIMNRALGASSKVHENSELLSFTIQDIPQKFDLSSADVLNCLSMSYKITWPLNILLPCDTIEKYQQVFKYLLKLHHISWILQKMFQELKISSYQGKEINPCVLTQSTQYHRIQLYRHVMTHFIQTLQNYTVSEVLQASWEELEHNMETVNTLDQLYTVHVIYVKTIIFRCLLNKQCAPIMKVINEIFVVILKFYNQLKSRSWKFSDDNEFIHPSYKKLNDIFRKFEEYTNFVFRVGNKMARVGYQPHLVQMLDMLNMNSYYTKNQ